MNKDEALVDKDEALAKYEYFLRYVFNDKERFTEENKNKVELLRRNAVKSGCSLIEIINAYERTLPKK